MLNFEYAIVGHGLDDYFLLDSLNGYLLFYYPPWFGIGTVFLGSEDLEASFNFNVCVMLESCLG